MNVNERRIESRENILKVMDKTFVMIPTKLLRDVAERKISSSAFQVYCYVLFRRGTKDKFWGSVKDICWGTGFEEAQVSRLLKQLVEAGHVRRVKRVARTWDTYCLTRVDDHKIIYRGKAVDCALKDAAMDGDTERKALASDREGAAHDCGEDQSGQSANDNEISEAMCLFEEEICRQQAKSDKLRRELLGPSRRSSGRFYPGYHSNISDHY